MNNQYIGQGLVCNLDGIPSYVGSEYFTPITMDQLVDLTRRYLWKENRSDYFRQYMNTTVVPVYCFMLGIDENGNPCIHKFRRFNDTGHDPDVEWLRGHWVSVKKEIQMSSFLDAITTSSIDPRMCVDEPWYRWSHSDNTEEAQAALDNVLLVWREARGSHFEQRGPVDINESFYVGTFTDGGCERKSLAPFWGGLVVLLTVPIYRTPYDIIIPSRTVNLMSRREWTFIPRRAMSLLDEVGDLEDNTCPILPSFLNAIMGINHPYF